MSKATCRRFRPAVELLESREVPASFTATTVPELISAIDAANLTPEADTITLAAGKTFTLTAVNNTNHGATGTPTVAPGGLAVLGNGSVIERSRVKGTQPFRLLDVDAGASLALEGLTLQGGLAFGYNGAAFGGAVYSQGTLTLNGVTVKGNSARGADGTTGFGTGTPGAAAAGGGVYSTGTLVMRGCLVERNSALGGRGGAGGVFRISPGGNPIYGPGGAGGGAYGSGVYAAGTLTLRDTTITENTATGGPGGNGAKGQPDGAKGQGIGGGLYIDPAAAAGLDAFTVDHVKLNKASSSGPNIAGSYVVIL